MFVKVILCFCGVITTIFLVLLFGLERAHKGSLIRVPVGNMFIQCCCRWASHITKWTLKMVNVGSHVIS